MSKSFFTLCNARYSDRAVFAILRHEAMWGCQQPFLLVYKSFIRNFTPILNPNLFGWLSHEASFESRFLFIYPHMSPRWFAFFIFSFRSNDKKKEIEHDRIDGWKKSRLNGKPGNRTRTGFCASLKATFFALNEIAKLSKDRCEWIIFPRCLFTSWERFKPLQEIQAWYEERIRAP